MNEEKHIHEGYKEYHERIKPRFPEMDCMFGKYQYIFSSNKGKISCVNLPNYLGDGYYWEIYAFEDKNLFTDVKRFKTLKEAREEARRYLD